MTFSNNQKVQTENSSFSAGEK